ncbi:MAG TPA: c-type cytochrome [Terriglobia bacterium]|nr:c-type cytochrome [Terriglobia bacterium]
MFRRTDHPVRAYQWMLRNILLMARPPLLFNEGNTVFRILGTLIIFVLAISTMQAQQEGGDKLVNDGDCHSCHSIDHKVVGPSYIDIAKKYATQANAAEQLARSIRQGGSGNWGDLRMPAHPDLNDAQLTEIVRWILSLKDATPGGTRQIQPKEYTYTVNDKKVTLNFPIFVEGNDQMVTKDVFRGYQVYNSYCYRCHGTDVTESELAPDLRRFAAATTPQEFLPVVMAGREDKGMPMWAGFFTEEEVQQIYKYVKGRSLDLIPVGRPRSEFDSSKN